MRTLPKRIEQWMRELRAAEAAFDIEAILLGAIMDRESLGGEALQPKGPNGTGDNGHGHGLMQIDDRYHKGFIEATDSKGKPLWQIPAFNVLYAASYFDCLRIQLDGHGADPTLLAIAAYNCGPSRVRLALAEAPPTCPRQELIQALDRLTTQGNYVSDVIERRSRFLLKA